jgi:general secretion pathway protein K
VDGLRSYYLASGAVQRAAMEMLWSINMPEPKAIPPGAPFVDYVFPSGNVRVEIIPETAKLDVNFIPVQDLLRLGLALGLEPDRAQLIAAAIDDWRRPAAEGSPFDQYYLSLAPSFRARHASFEQIEELLLVRGVTPDIYYGTYIPASDGADPNQPRLVPRGGLADCLSVFGSKDRVDVNSASPAVLAAVGLNPYAIAALLQRRRLGPLDGQQLFAFMQSLGIPPDRLRAGGNSVFTLRATARLRLANGQLSDLKRTVAAQVKYMQQGSDTPIHFLRWYDTAWSN